MADSYPYRYRVNGTPYQSHVQVITAHEILAQAGLPPQASTLSIRVPNQITPVVPYEFGLYEPIMIAGEPDFTATTP